jgi:hypothetical protein
VVCSVGAPSLQQHSLTWIRAHPFAISQGIREKGRARNASAPRSVAPVASRETCSTDARRRFTHVSMEAAEELQQAVAGAGSVHDLCRLIEGRAAGEAVAPESLQSPAITNPALHALHCNIRLRASPRRPSCLQPSSPHAHRRRGVRPPARCSRASKPRCPHRRMRQHD